MRRIVSVNSKLIETYQKGKGEKTVLILPGMFNSFYDWYEIINELSQNFRVITFHRPGFGKSEFNEVSPKVEDVSLIALKILEILKISNPIILVGFSYGGLVAQHFARIFPEKVSSVVLVESTSIDLHLLDELDLSESDTDEYWIEKCSVYGEMNQSELKELIKPQLTEKQLRFPPKVQKNLLEFSINPSNYKAMGMEIQGWKKCACRIKQSEKFPNVPLIVIGRDFNYSVRALLEEGIPFDKAMRFENLWRKLILDQVNYSCRSKFVIAHNSGHSVYDDRPDVILKAIFEIILK